MNTEKPANERHWPGTVRITVQMTAKDYAKLEKALKAAQKDVPALKTVDDLVKHWIEGELAE